MRVALVDDQLLGSILRGSVPRTLRRRSIATTGCWYVRLCQAVLRADGRNGALSGPFSMLPDPLRQHALDQVLELPEEIDLPSFRLVGPPIGRLRPLYSLNLLGMEALAAAEYLDADVFLSTASPRLEAALAAQGHRWRTLKPD